MSLWKITSIIYDSYLYKKNMGFCHSLRVSGGGGGRRIEGKREGEEKRGEEGGEGGGGE